MSQENVEAFKRASDASGLPGDIDALLAEMDPDVEWHPVMAALLGGEATVYRGHEGVRDWLQDLSEAFAESDVDYSEIRDLGERILAIGRLRARGKESGARIESPLAFLVEFKKGKVIHVKTYLDPNEAIEAAGFDGSVSDP